jgi:Zn-dependent peptidase ImmA (M78 family)/DNA-binding XRE family transcriptional regulator
MPKVNHSILQWARETSKLTIEEAAHKFNLRAENLAAYESGKKEPSRNLLLRMSKQYHQPLLTFYLDKPPTICNRGNDFRTLPDQFGEVENAHLDVLIRDVRARQSIIRETLIDVDEEIRLDFIGKHTINSSEARVVKTIQEAFDINLNDYRRQPKHQEAFRFLRHKVEQAGVFVLLIGNLGSYHSNIDVKAFRGFALADDIAPLIVINDQDAESAWSFTLLHELAHLILGETGISGENGEKQIEKFCNNVASEFLLPKAEFDNFRIHSLEPDRLAVELSNYADTRKLSSSHIAYRLFRRRDINRSLWEKLRDYYRKMWQDNRRKKREKNRNIEGGPSYYTVKHYKLGTLVDLVQRLTYSGDISTTKAGMLLDVKPLKVHQLFQV